MNRSQARSLAILGAAGLLTLATLTFVVVAQSDFGSGQRLALANCGPTGVPGTVVHVTLSDRGGAMMGGANPMMVSLYASPNTVSAGTVTFIATNVGALNHELLVLPAPADGVGTRAVGSDGKIDESSSLGEASTSCGSGAGQGISPGATSWVTLHLTPGNYELLCDVPWHYANGMFTKLRVN
jgi:uncharacterized cupredoxin-like copper-binding protein